MNADFSIPKVKINITFFTNSWGSRRPLGNPKATPAGVATNRLRTAALADPVIRQLGICVCFCDFYDKLLKLFVRKSFFLFTKLSIDHTLFIIELQCFS